MKKYLLLMVLGLTITFNSAQAQNEKFKPSADKKMQRYLSIMDTAKTEATWNLLGKQFDLIGQKHPDSWLAKYHSAFAYSIYAMRVTDMKVRDFYLDAALALADKADSIHPNESEIYVLRGMITAMKISVDPERGMKFGQESSILLQKGKDLNKDNPRVYLELGESAMYTPEQYGGGKKKSKELLTKAVEKFKTFKSDNPSWPHWGADRAKILLEKVKSL